MKYFIDTEFLEGLQTNGGPLFNFWIGKKKDMPTIDLISIGIVAEDGREYYAISKDFNLKEAWNRFELDGDGSKTLRGQRKYWIRENILLPIYLECVHGDSRNRIPFSYSGMKWVLRTYGKTNKQIAEEIKEFCSIGTVVSNRGLNIRTYTELNDLIKTWIEVETIENNYPIHFDNKPVFYGYYADYDWVVFCWLFGSMNSLPKNFPMYCVDLKQELERLNETLGYNCDSKGISYKIQKHIDYPKQVNEHNALADARWNEELFNFLTKMTQHDT
jgi:hypothetical protein